MTSVFISHSTSDRSYVEREIIGLLQRHGLKPWYASREIRTASDWERSILAALRDSDWFLVAISPNAISSAWVRSEVDWALEHRPGRLIPVLISPCDPSTLHLRLRLLQYVDFTQGIALARARLLGIWPSEATAISKEEVVRTRLTNGTSECQPKQELLRNSAWASHLEATTQYTIVKTIAIGSSSTVFLARQNLVQRLVAVKVLNAGRALPSNWKTAFTTEAVFSHHGLMHPAIVNVYDIHLWDDDQGGVVCIVMEYVEGPNLLDFTQTDALTFAEIADLTARIAEALDFIHKRGLAHGGLNPTKVLLDLTHSPHIIGFYDRRRDDVWSLSYCAPEVILHAAVSPAADIWSLGAILYELLAGRRAFQHAASKDDLIRSVAAGTDALPPPFAPTVPDQLQRICVRCLSRDPRERYTEAAGLSQQLRSWKNPTIEER